ncbi:hypothetical protein GCM10022221_36570 [Actinocorallia aurea]
MHTAPDGRSRPAPHRVAGADPARSGARGAELTAGALLRAFPEAATLWFGQATGVWRALVRVDGRDAWLTADTLEHLGHALWRLRRAQGAAPARPSGAGTGAYASPAPLHRRPPLRPVPAPACSPPGSGRDPDRAPRRPGLLARLTGRTRRTAA